MRLFSDPKRFMVIMTNETRNEIGQLLTIADLADRLQLAEVTIRKKLARGEIPHVRIGRAIRFRPEDIDAWLDDQRAAA